MEAKLEIHPSTIAGNGVFANSDIPAGARIVFLTGKRISEEEADALLDSRELRADDVFQVQETEYLVLDLLPVRINHSCDPNGGVRGENELMALHNIKKGEEITYDYSTVVGTSNNGWTMRCSCSSRLCRKTIGSIASLPSARVRYYEERAALPYFIVDELSQTKDARRTNSARQRNNSGRF